jgi:methylmalonyl-CoA/ethylmalonyl-CoA epimerase
MKLHHIGIAVRELEEAVVRYQLLGLKETARSIVEEFRVAVSWLGDEFPKLELIQPLGEGPVQRFLETRGEGLHHVAYAVPDIEAALEDLKSKGIPLVDERPRPGFGGHRVAFLHPREFAGVLVELVEGSVNGSETD